MFLAGKFIHQGIDTTVAVLVAWVYLDTRHRTAFNGLPSSLLPSIWQFL